MSITNMIKENLDAKSERKLKFYTQGYNSGKAALTRIQLSQDKLTLEDLQERAQDIQDNIWFQQGELDSILAYRLDLLKENK